MTPALSLNKALTDWLTNWLIYWLTDWLTDSLTHARTRACTYVYTHSLTHSLISYSVQVHVIFDALSCWERPFQVYIEFLRPLFRYSWVKIFEWLCLYFRAWRIVLSVSADAAICRNLASDVRPLMPRFISKPGQKYEENKMFWLGEIFPKNEQIFATILLN